MISQLIFMSSMRVIFLHKCVSLHGHDKSTENCKMVLAFGNVVITLYRPSYHKRMLVVVTIANVYLASVGLIGS